MDARTPSSDAAYFCIEVAGILDPRWRPRFAGLEFHTLRHAERSTTRMLGWLHDQAELHAVLAAIRDLGLDLLALQRFADEPDQLPA